MLYVISLIDMSFFITSVDVIFFFFLYIFFILTIIAFINTYIHSTYIHTYIHTYIYVCVCIFHTFILLFSLSIYKYKIETFETPTIFHVNILFYFFNLIYMFWFFFPTHLLTSSALLEIKIKSHYFHKYTLQNQYFFKT